MALLSLTSNTASKVNSRPVRPVRENFGTTAGRSTNYLFWRMSESIIHHSIQISGSDANPDFKHKEWLVSHCTSNSGSNAKTGTCLYSGDIYIIAVMFYHDNGAYMSTHTDAEYIPEKVTLGTQFSLLTACGVTDVSSYIKTAYLLVNTDYTYTLQISGNSGKKKTVGCLIGYL